MKFRSIFSLFVQAIVLIFVLSGCSATTPMKAQFEKAPVVTPFYDSYWLLREDLIFEAIREGDNKEFKITVPAGFVTDLASIPVPLNVIYDKTGRYSSAGILHDYLYWTQFCDRKSSDRLIKEGLKATGAGYRTRNTIKLGVYWFGWAAWDSNKKAKEAGVERYVPENMRVFRPSTRWEDYRKTIPPKQTDPPWKSSEVERDVKAGCDVFKDAED